MGVPPHPYRDLLPSVERPSRYVGGEFQSIVKPDAEIRFALAFPDLYEIGMSHLGFKILYSILNGCPDIVAERVFSPWTDLEAAIRKAGSPLVSLETYRPLRTFDIVGFSLQYEMTYTNVLAMLDLAGIPLRGRDRTEEDPLIVAGGPCATSPEPMSPFIDVFVIGDGEEIAVELARAWKRRASEGLSRREMIQRLASWPGLYVPSAYETEMDVRSGLEVVRGPSVEGALFPISRRVVDDLNKFPYPDDSPVAFTEVVFNRFSVELARGCTEGCRFCQAGMIYRPVRERSPKDVIHTVMSGLKKGGYDEASLTSLSTADYSCVSPLLKELAKELRSRQTKLGLASLRAYGLPEDVLDEMAEGNTTGLTFAPEAGTQRMRDVVAKNISEEDMLEAARRIGKRGWNRAKLYFMIGLPTETDEDVAGIIEISHRTALAGGEAAGRRFEVTVSISSHVPKPHTPFQWAGMDSLEEIERKQHLVARMARERRLTLRKHNARISRIEGVLSRGDCRVGEAIEVAFRKGCRFDGWDEKFQEALWFEAFSETNVDVVTYLRPLPLDGKLPWGHINVGVETEFLAREYRRALQGRLSPPCGKPFGEQVHFTNLQDHEAGADRKLVCYHCGIACDLSQMKEERGTFLTSLAALGPTPTRPEKIRQRRPLKPVAGAGYRYRFGFTKLEPASYVSHLDLVRMLQRHFRRAGLDVVQTGGYHPRPMMSFGPALALGVQSLAELVDVTLVQLEPLEPILSRLNQVTDAGIEYRSARLVEPGERSVSQSIVAAKYLVWTADVVDSSTILDRYQRGSTDRIEVDRNGRVRTYEMGREVIHFEPCLPETLPESFRRVPIAAAFQFQLAVRPEGALRPQALMEFLSEGQEARWEVVRSELEVERASSRQPRKVCEPPSQVVEALI